MSAKKTEIPTPSELLRSHLNLNIYFLQVRWCGGGEEKTRTEGQKGEKRREGGKRREEEIGREGEEEGGKRRKEAWPEEKKWKTRVKELKLEIDFMKKYIIVMRVGRGVKTTSLEVAIAEVNILCIYYVPPQHREEGAYLLTDRFHVQEVTIFCGYIAN